MYSGFETDMYLSSSEYRLFFDYNPMGSIWAWVAVAGGSVPAIACFVGLFWWRKCRLHQWEAHDRKADERMRCWGTEADMAWLL